MKYSCQNKKKSMNISKNIYLFIFHKKNFFEFFLLKIYLFLENNMFNVQHSISFQTTNILYGGSTFNLVSNIFEFFFQMLEKLRKFDCKRGIYEDICKRIVQNHLSYLNNITNKKKTLIFE
jgi:hypothetical protein